MTSSNDAPDSAGRPRLSLCMIVRDSSKTLEACLAGVRSYVDEIVVVDTGSVDHTKEIARRFGARIFDFPWCDDFSAARNESLRHATGDWVFWMDSDDTIDEENGRKLKDLALRPLSDAPIAYVMQVHCPRPTAIGYDDVTVVDHVKMFRNLPALRFSGRIHEQILPAVRQVSGVVEWTDIYVVHSGSDHSPEGRQRKQERDLRILHKEAEEQPNHPFVAFNLGMTYADMSEFQVAARYLEKSLQLSGPTESHVRKAYALLTYCYNQQSQFERAREVCLAGLERFPGDVELSFRNGVLAHHFGDHAQAITAYQSALQEQSARHFSSVDNGIAGYKSRHNMALVYAECGRHDLAELQWRLALDKAPEYRQGWGGLGDALVKQSKLVTAELTAASLLQTSSRRVEGFLLLSDLASQAGNFDRAAELLHEASVERPNDPQLLHRRCWFYLEHEDLEQAVETLTQLCQKDPHNASVYHNLGTVYYKQGRRSAAVAAYRESLRLRPDSEQTQRQLNQVLQELEQDESAELAAAGTAQVPRQVYSR